MTLSTITRRILGSILTPFRTLSNNSSGPVRVFKGIRAIKCNAFVRTRRQSVIRFRKGSCRQISDSCHTRSDPLEGIYFHMRPVPVMMSYESISRFDRRFIAPKTRYSGFPGLEKKFYPMESQWRLYTQCKEPGSPDVSKGGTISGVSIKKLNATSIARINKVKQMLKDKAMLKGNCKRLEKPK